MRFTPVSCRYVFNRKKKLNDKGKALVQLEIRVGTERKYYTTHIYLKPYQWDGSRIIKHNNAFRLNNTLTKKISKVNDLLPKVKTINEADAVMRGSSPDSFIDYFQQANDSFAKAYSTWKQYNAALNHLRRFGKIKTFGDLTVENIQYLTDHLRSLGLSDQTVYNIHKRVKTIVRRAYLASRIDRNPYDQVKVERGRPGKIRYLTSEEIALIEEKEFFGGMEKAKDLFLFSCYTGLSFSDLSKFDYKNIITEDDEQWITDPRKKTGEQSIVMILPKARAVIDKYPGGLPKMTNQVVNRYLKDIADYCGINKNLTFHMARHTCAVYLLNNGVPLEVVSKILGHRSIKTTEIYAKVLKKTIKGYLKGL